MATVQVHIKGIKDVLAAIEKVATVTEMVMLFEQVARLGKEAAACGRSWMTSEQKAARIAELNFKMKSDATKEEAEELERLTGGQH